ncbi:MAG TPA: S1 RNA-binding domain-containing protein [Terriglobales bacterium]|nr:S1 RNA-binding domain-containing protein [Terriglobales bacterium]
MSDPNTPPSPNENDESFGDLLAAYEQSHKRKPGERSAGLQGTVVAVTADSAVLDIGFKSEGVLPLTAFTNKPQPKRGDKFPVSIKGRNPEGYYELSLGRIEQPKDWAALQRAFAEKTTIGGTVTAVVKGGLSVDVGVRAFMPASRSGVRDAAEMEKLVGQDIRCRIIKLDVEDEDLVVDRRVVAEEDDRAARERRLSEIAEGATVTGVVQSLTDYGAFVDIGGVDALLHVGDISWARVSNPAVVLSVGQQVEVKILKMSNETGKRRISVGMKQLLPHPWDGAAQKYIPGERVRGTVTRVMEFGAFVELEPGIEGLIHISEMSWARKVRRASDVVKPGDTVEAVILGVNEGERRISLGLKQALGDPWADAPQRFPAGSIVEGPITNITKFGAFVQLAGGIEGMIHIGDMSAEKRINHPQEVLRVGQTVKAQVLEIDSEKRRVRLGIKQMAPSSLDEYMAEHKQGEIVSGRMVETTGNAARVELGEGVYATCRITEGTSEQSARQPGQSKADLSSLSSLLQARWKSGSAPKRGAASAGQIRSFRITQLDPGTKKIEVELA